MTIAIEIVEYEDWYDVNEFDLSIFYSEHELEKLDIEFEDFMFQEYEFYVKRMQGYA